MKGVKVAPGLGKIKKSWARSSRFAHRLCSFCFTFKSRLLRSTNKCLHTLFRYIVLNIVYVTRLLITLAYIWRLCKAMFNTARFTVVVY